MFVSHTGLFVFKNDFLREKPIGLRDKHAGSSGKHAGL